jgi:hypothetical protein
MNGTTTIASQAAPKLADKPRMNVRKLIRRFTEIKI